LLRRGASPDQNRQKCETFCCMAHVRPPMDEPSPETPSTARSFGGFTDAFARKNLDLSLRAPGVSTAVHTSIAWSIQCIFRRWLRSDDSGECRWRRRR
jgi:hypothetical protein